MIQRIFRVEDIEKLKSRFPEKVLEHMKLIVETLDDNYRKNRNITDDGGYICVLRTADEVNYLKINLIKGLVEEYSDVIYKSKDEVYNSTLYLLSSDYSLVVITEDELTDQLLK